MSQLEDEDDNSSYYAVLNVAKDSTQEDIKKAYRSLASVFHPDKHRDESVKDQAQQAFARLQEAYEVLSDPERRQIYDIYGKQGLEAGLQVGSKLKSKEELRQEWQDFQERQERRRQEAMTNHRGYYMCKLDAEPWLRNPRQLRLGDFKIVVVQSSIDAPVTDNDIFHLQGSAALRGHHGSGSFVAGYRRVISHDDSLDFTAVVGLRTVLSLTTTRQLSPYSSASLSGTWSAADGVGLQLQTTRQLFGSSQGTFSWVVGPASDASMGLALTHRSKKYVVTAKLDVGHVVSISGKLQWFYREDLHVRLAARLGTSGIDCEMGLFRRWSPYRSGYVGTVVGLHGTTLKGRYTQGQQVFEFPVALSRDVREWQVMVAALVLPPLASLVLSRCVVRPALRWHKRRREAAALQESRQQVEQQLQVARGQAELLAPVAKRKARAEGNKQGLVVLEAVYGRLEGYFEEQGSSTLSISGTSSSSAADGEASSSAAAAAAAAGDKEQQQELPQYLDVTHALQYLVKESKLQLHGDISKLGLMGFADVAPGAAKQLHVVYSHSGQVYEVTVGDEQRLVLPGAGQEVREGAQKLAAVLARGSARLGLRAEMRHGWLHLAVDSEGELQEGSGLKQLV